jgi:chromosome segregation ATPase
MITPIAPGVPPSAEEPLQRLIAFVTDISACRARIEDLAKARDEHDAARDAAQTEIGRQAAMATQNERDAAANKATAADLERQKKEFAQERAESQQRLMKADKELEAGRQKLAQEIAQWGEKRATEQAAIDAARDAVNNDNAVIKSAYAKLEADTAEANKLMETAKTMKAEAQRQLDEMAEIVKRRAT